MKITREQALRIAAEAQVDPRTVIAISEGKKSKAIVLERVLVAAKKLRIRL